MTDGEWIIYFMRMNNLSFDDVVKTLKMLVEMRDRKNTELNDDQPGMDDLLETIN
jgi:hypothetical protein